MKLYQHILVNCCINNCNNVAKIDEMKIIFNKSGDIEFNIETLIKNFAKNVKNLEAFFKAIGSRNMSNISVVCLNNHIAAMEQLLYFKNKNVCMNYTHPNIILIINKNGILEKRFFTKLHKAKS